MMELTTSMPAKPAVTMRLVNFWPVTTTIWFLIALTLPAYRIMPSSLRTIWFAFVFSLILAAVLCRRVRPPLYPTMWLFGGYTAVVAVITATSEASITSNLFVGTQLVVMLGFGAMVMTANSLNDYQFAPRVALAFLIGQTISATVGILQISGKSVFGNEAVHGRASGLAGHPNTLGLMSCIAILLALFSIITSKHFRMVAATALILNIGGILSSGSLSALMAALIGLFVLVSCLRERFARLIVGSVGFAVAAWAVGNFTGLLRYIVSPADRYRQVTGQTAADSSWDIRLRTYHFALERIREQPIFGNGLSARYGGTFDGTTLTHNILLRSWYQGGILLCVALTIIFIALAVTVAISITRKLNGCEASVLAATTAFAMTSAFFEQPDYWLPIIIAWGSLSAKASLTNSLPTWGRQRVDLLATR